MNKTINHDSFCVMIKEIKEDFMKFKVADTFNEQSIRDIFKTLQLPKKRVAYIEYVKIYHSE